MYLPSALVLFSLAFQMITVFSKLIGADPLSIESCEVLVDFEGVLQLDGVPYPYTPFCSLKIRSPLGTNIRLTSLLPSQKGYFVLDGFLLGFPRLYPRKISEYFIPPSTTSDSVQLVEGRKVEEEGLVHYTTAQNFGEIAYNSSTPGYMVRVEFIHNENSCDQLLTYDNYEDKLIFRSPSSVAGVCRWYLPTGDAKVVFSKVNMGPYHSADQCGEEGAGVARVVSGRKLSPPNTLHTFRNICSPQAVKIPCEQTVLEFHHGGRGEEVELRVFSINMKDRVHVLAHILRATGVLLRC